jgi:DNA transformation protein
VFGQRQRGKLADARCRAGDDIGFLGDLFSGPGVRLGVVPGLSQEWRMSDRFDDLFAEFGPIRLRRFFGGEGIYADDVMIGMVFSDVIYFKTDEETRKAFVAEKSKPFSFLKRSTGETVVTTWFALPDRLYDEPDELARWARAALDVARHAETVKKKMRAVKKAGRKKTAKKKTKKPKP